MKLNRYLHIVVAVVVTALIVGSLMYLRYTSDIKSKQHLLEQRIASKDAMIDDLKIRIARLEEALLTKPAKLPDDLLKVYKIDAISDTKGVDFCVAVPVHYTLIEKLKLISGLLNKYRFPRGLIELKKIEQRSSKKIAVIELKETEKYPTAWRGLYFQGSCGGSATTYILTNTFLQPDYTGKWIDGVEFWYDGKPITDDWDHIFLHGTMYRKN